MDDGRRNGAAHASFLAQRRFASLNGLRCLAILEVIWQHSSGRSTGPWTRGIGVDLSFAISGFLITTLLAREFTATGTIDVRRFYARRTLRIFPLYFAVLGLYLLLVLATREGTPEGKAFMHHLPAFATYTTNWFVPLGHSASNIFFFSWSLATQEQFYLSWAPALLLCLAPGRWARAGAVVAALIAINQTALHAIGGQDLPLTVVRSIATPICLGALWALTLHSPPGFAAAKRVLGHRIAAPAILLAVVVSFAAVAPTGLLELLLAALVAACCIREDHLAAPLLKTRPMVLVGEVSYGMYLLHMLGVNAARPLVGEHVGVPVFVVGSFLTVAMAYASFRWFESPILRYRDRPSRSRARRGRAPRAAPARSRA